MRQEGVERIDTTVVYSNKQVKKFIWRGLDPAPQLFHGVGAAAT